jgi:hypothetical protein
VKPVLATVLILLAIGPCPASADDQTGGATQLATELHSPPERSGAGATPVATQLRRAPDRLDLETTSIRGNQELPKVLYILPWKDPGLAEPAGRPLNSLVDEALAPVDREVFRRQLRYFDQLYGGAESKPEPRD